MLFTLAVAGAASQALGLRPAYTASARSAHFAKLRDLANAVQSDPPSSMKTLHEVAGVVNDILVQEGNATQHLSDPEMQVLREVISIVRDSMYSRMDFAQSVDEGALAAAIAAINACSQEWTHRIEQGDIYNQRGRAVSHQNDLNQLQAIVDAKTLANTTAWNNLASHISLISEAPSCSALPNPRTVPSLDVYFEGSEYATWYMAQKDAYWPLREAWRVANRELEEALAAYAVGLAVRDVSYCDWKRELEAGCVAYTECYNSAVAHYVDHVSPTVHHNMLARMEVYKSGETIIYQIRFLLAEVADQQTPAIDPHPYHMGAFPAVPPFTPCDFSPLDDDMWVPTPVCPDMCDETVDLGHRQDGYRGCQTHTESGQLCREWTQGEIDHWVGKGLGRHNYCRNPDHEPEGIWCWKAAGGWEYCDPVPPPPTPPPTPPTPAPGTWEIHGDGCQAAGQCIQSMNYPSAYDNHQSCSVSLFGRVAVQVTDGFNTERNFDFLIVGGQEYHGDSIAQAQLNGVYTGANAITWQTDHSVVRSGWELCLAPAPMKQLLDGCSRGGNVFSAWGNPRMESADQRAGEAVCCDNAGTCTRRISSGSGEFSGFSHQNCITPDGGRLDDGVDTPSWTWNEAKAHCEAAGLRLPANQEEMDTSCNTGCHTNFVLAWTA